MKKKTSYFENFASVVRVFLIQKSQNKDSHSIDEAKQINEIKKDIENTILESIKKDL